jgi:predicted RNase H-like nuclease (RuvC/YqgF family)
MSLHIKDVIEQFPLSKHELSELLLVSEGTIRSAVSRGNSLEPHYEAFLRQVLQSLLQSDESALDLIKENERLHYQNETSAYVDFELMALRRELEKTEEQLAKMKTQQNRAARRLHHVDLLRKSLATSITQQAHIQRWLEMIALLAQLELHTYGHLPQLKLKKKIAGLKGEIGVLEG